LEVHKDKTVIVVDGSVPCPLSSSPPTNQRGRLSLAVSARQGTVGQTLIQCSPNNNKYCILRSAFFGQSGLDTHYHHSSLLQSSNCQSNCTCHHNQCRQNCLLKWSNTPERNCILPEVLVKTALISMWTKLFVHIGFFTDSLLDIYTCSSPSLSKWGEKGKKRKCDIFPAKFEKK
jgi:hypothetical protein